MMSCRTACWCSLQVESQQQALQRSSSKKVVLLPAAAAASASSRICSSIPHHQQEHDEALLGLLRAHDTDAAFGLFSAHPELLPCSPTTASRLLAQLSLDKSSSSSSRALVLLQRLRGRNALSLLDANALSLAAAAAARSGNATLAHSLILYMLRQGLFPDRRAYTAAVAASAPSKAVRLFDAVLRHLRQSEQLVVPAWSLPDTAAFNAALNACADAGDGSRFRQLWLDLQEPDAVSYNILLKMCARLGRKELLPRVLRRMVSEDGVAPCGSTFHSLVAAYVGLGDIATAETIVQAMREQTDLLSLLLGDVATQEAALLDDILVTQGQEEENEPPPLLPPRANARVYTTLMKGYMNAGRVHDVLATLRAMRREAQTFPASRPDHVTYTTVISALVAAGDMDRARAVLDQEMAADGVPPNRVTYNVLLKGYCHQLQMSKARDLFQAMGETMPDVVTYNTLMDGCVATDDTAGALALFNEMRSRGIAPSAVSYTTLMKAFAAAGQPKTAHKVFDEMQKDPGVKKVDRAAWNMLVEAYCRVGQLERAKQVMESMKRDGGFQPDTATYGSLAKAVRNKPGEALLLWNEVKERCPDPDEELLEALADVCVRAAFFRKALEIVACMEERGIAPNKTKYKKMYIQMHSRMFTSKHASQARQDRRRDRKRAAEAFKFWLGLPNEYYGTTTEWRLDLDDDYHV